MPGTVITTIPELQSALANAVALEYATIPVYLCGCWTIKDQNSQVASLIRDVAIAEMRHLAVAANTLIATGGTPRITAAVNAHPFPAFLPDGESEFQVDLLPFGPAFLQQAMKIEQPTPTTGLPPIMVRAPVRRHKVLGGNSFLTIGQFYDSIITGIETLTAQLGAKAVFPNGANVANQFGVFDGLDISVTSSTKAIALLTDTIDEGEGSSGKMFDETNNLAHFYVFQEILFGRLYLSTDVPGTPTGLSITIPNGNDVFNMHTTPKMADFVSGSGVWDDAFAFNDRFTSLITVLNIGFSGEPDLVGSAITEMSSLQPLAAKVFANPFPGAMGVVAGPTFELTTPCQALQHKLTELEDQLIQLQDDLAGITGEVPPGKVGPAENAFRNQIKLVKEELAATQAQFDNECSSI